MTRRHVASWFEADERERAALLDGTLHARRMIEQHLGRTPDGYNIGINAGIAAGQTVMHLHVHVIPRFEGDVDNPRGGVRHCIPGKGEPGTAPGDDSV